jgi:hypothetical protein
MSANPNAYLVIILYTDKYGRSQSIGTVTFALDEHDAVSAAVEAVASLPHVASVEGGTIEPLDASFEPRAPSVPSVPSAPRTNAQGDTLH